MELKKALESRRAVRSFSDQPVSKEDLETILKAGCAAPVGFRAYDTVHLTVVQQEEALNGIRELVSKAYNDPAYDPVYGAKTLVLVSGKKRDNAPGIEYCNAGCILENMLLQATELGIASIYLLSISEAFKQGSPMFEKLQIPEGFTPVSGAAFGYAKETPEARELSISLAVNMIQ